MRWLSALSIPQVDDLHVYGFGASLMDCPVRTPAIMVNRARCARQDIPADYWLFIDRTHDAMPGADNFTGKIVCLEESSRRDNAWWFRRGGTRFREQSENALYSHRGTQGAMLNFACFFRPRRLHLWGSDFLDRYADGTDMYTRLDGTRVSIRQFQQAEERLRVFEATCALALRSGVGEILWHVWAPYRCTCACGRSRPHLAGVRYDAPRFVTLCPDVPNGRPPPSPGLPPPWQANRSNPAPPAEPQPHQQRGTLIDRARATRHRPTQRGKKI